MSYPTKIRTFNRGRTGLSIVEVLTSIVVAMIGVFGVMVLIPFAVKQAQVGLDSDAAVTAARNATSQLEVAGYRYPGNWAFERITPSNGTFVNAQYSPYLAVDWNNDGNLTTADDRNGDGVTDNLDGDYPQPFSIDPLALMEIAADANPPRAVPNAADYFSARFPFQHVDVDRLNGAVNALHDYPVVGVEDLVIPAATLRDATGAIMTREMARRMFRTANDLVFGEQTADFGGPVQFSDTEGGVNQRRQSLGRISWNAIVVPFKNNPGSAGAPTPRWSYRMYILVYKDRKFLPPLTAGESADGAMATVQLDTFLDGGQALSQINHGVKSPLGNVYVEAATAAGEIVFKGALKRDDWVLLINRARNTNATNHPIFPGDGNPPGGVTYAEKGFDKQLAFCRVVNFADEPKAGNALASVTLDGPDFNFGDSTLPFTDAERVIQRTYMVHLKDVVTVYERTFTPESQSTWNLAN